MARKKSATSFHEMAGLDAMNGMDSVQTAANANQTWIRGVGACNAEATRFIGRRLAKDFGVSSELASCQTPTDILEVQASFIQTMISDYAEEAQRISSIVIETLAKEFSEQSGKSA